MIRLLGFWFRRILPGWFLIGLMIFLIQIAICGIVHDNERVKNLLDFMDILPSIVKSALGGESLRMGNFAALIAMGYHHPLVLLLYMLFAVGTPTALLTGEVQTGTMELILSCSVSKFQVYVCAGILTMGGMFALVGVMYSGTIAGTHIYHFPKPVDLWIFFRLAVNGGLMASTVGAIALVSAATFSRRNIAVGVTVVYLVANYFVSVTSEWWPVMKPFGPFSLFHYVGRSGIGRGWPVTDMTILAAVMIVAAVAGAVVWQRRDLPL